MPQEIWCEQHFSFSGSKRKKLWELLAVHRLIQQEIAPSGTVGQETRQCVF
jgi:hypothetical protein